MSVLAGLLAGIFGGLVGLGGGVVMIPLMVEFMKLGQHRAHGTSLVAVVFTGIAGALTYWVHGSVDWTAAALLAASAIFTAHWGARFAGALADWVLKRSFGGFLIAVSLLLLLKPYLPHLAAGSLAPWAQVALLLFAGTLTGFFSGMMGVGGGTIMVPAMVLLLGFGQHIAQGSSLLAMVPAGAAGAWTHRRLGNVETGLLWGLIPGVLLGTYVGGSIANRLPEVELRVIFAAVLIWTGVRYLRAQTPNRGGCLAQGEGNAPSGLNDR